LESFGPRERAYWTFDKLNLTHVGSKLAEMEKILRAKFKEMFIDDNPAQTVEQTQLQRLWNMANDPTRRDLAASVIETHWLSTNLPSESLWGWVFFGLEVAKETTTKPWGCCYWNWASACNPTTGKVHPSERHHCYICGQSNHGASGTLVDVQDNECKQLSQYRGVVSTLAKKVGVELRVMVEFIGFGRTLPESIWIRIAKQAIAPDMRSKAEFPATSKTALVLRVSSTTGASTPSSTAALSDPEPVVVPADEREERLIKRIREILPSRPAGAAYKGVRAMTKEQPAAHNKRLFSCSDGRGGPTVYWCECDACKKPSEFRHPVFHGAYVPRQHDASTKELIPLRIVVKTFALDEHHLYIQELMTYEQLELCVPRPCAPLAMHGTHRRKGLVNAGEDDEHAELKHFIAVLNRGTGLPEFLQGHGNNLSKCLKVARGLAQAVALCRKSQVVHRALKPGNVLVHDPNGNCQVELIGFEGIHISRLQSTVQTPTSTALWSPPTKAVCQMGRKLDVGVALIRRESWTLGMLLYEILRNATCKLDVEKVTADCTAEQNAIHEQWMTALSTKSDGVALENLPLIIRDVGYCEYGVDLTVEDAKLTYEEGTYFPTTIHPLLKDLMARVMGMDPDKGFNIIPGQPQPYEQPFDVDTVCKGHVALQRFGTVLEALNCRIQKGDAVDDLCRMQDAIVNSMRGPAEEVIWAHNPLLESGPASGCEALTAIVVKHPWLFDPRKGTTVSPGL
jgi:hypothetical protein